VATSSLSSGICCWLAGTLLVAAMPAESAGPGFIESSRVFGDDSGADIEVRFNCKAQYLRHEPHGSGDHLRIFLDPTGICNGVSPLVANSRALLRPVNADVARLADLEYDGDSATGPLLTLRFTEPVTYTVDMSGVAFRLVVRITPLAVQSAPPEVSPAISHRQVLRPKEETPAYVINLASFQRIPTVADIPTLQLVSNQRIYYSAAEVDGATWYRLRLGDFESADAAKTILAGLKSSFPGAWIDQVDAGAVAVELAVAAEQAAAEPINRPDDEQPNSAAVTLVTADADAHAAKVDALMAQARQTMVAGETSRAIQIYTKIMQLPEHARQPEAQEYLALAREKNGQTAHAKAEYQRYLSLYPESDGAARVRQRLAALLASGRQPKQPADATDAQSSGRKNEQSDWRLQTFFTQYYRRDVNQPSDQDEIISQSALYSDINFDVRRRGQRFDFSSRLSAGYRNDFLGEDVGSGNQSRVSYAYADLSDARTGLRGRLGRQSRNTGGVLGRFDGLNLGYQASERILLNAVVGKPAYSSSAGIDSARTFYGTSINYGPLLENLELGLYFIQQDIEGLADRKAVGGEFRYFGLNQSFWGLIDYDTVYKELGSAFVQGSWRFASRLTLHGSIDQRHTPFLSIGNALIGQPVLEFANLLEIYPQDEIRQLGLDRSPLSTTYTLGMSHALTPKLQINADMNQTTVDATPASGGVAATPSTTYNYYATSLVASSLFKEGDVTIFGARYSDSENTRVISFTIDSRFSIGKTWRINPRLRVDRRERIVDVNYEWLYTPGIRIQYRRSQRFRVQLEAGKQFSQHETTDANLDRESYFVNFGYQAFF